MADLLLEKLKVEDYSDTIASLRRFILCLPSSQEYLDLSDDEREGILR